MPDAPKMVLPPPAPQNELEGLREGYRNQEVVPEKGVNPSPANGAGPPVRKDGGSARHPITKKWTKYRG